MRQPSYFDKYAKSYHEVLNRKVKLTGGTSDLYARIKAEIVAANLAGGEIETLLDVGCGDGLMEVHFRDLLKNADLIGLDVSSESIAVASQRHIERCKFLSYDGTQIPLPDHQVDVIFISCVLHHVPREQHEGLLCECMRALQPGGSIFVFEHNPLNPVTRHIVRECEFDRDANLIGATKLKAVALKAGFCQVKVRYTLFFPRHFFFKPFHRLERFMAGVPFGGQYFLAASKP